jgi:hypothetical protein
MQHRVLFVCKQRNLYGVTVEATDKPYSNGPSYGLINSCRLVGEALSKRLGADFDYKIVEVVDNNCIDREVAQYMPTHCIIEALWVVPSKFEVLCKLHPSVRWSVRLHSKGPFLANEGIATEWLNGYEKVKDNFDNFNWGVNDIEFRNDLEDLYDTDIDYLPNAYTVGPKKWDPSKSLPEGKTIDVACFGAVRPMKNHYQQAIAAITFADDMDLKLRFHINGTRTEQRGENVLKNVRALFEDTKHDLIEHPWMGHDEFMEVAARMDIAMQVSMSETFNIVAADFVSLGVPLVASREIPWMTRLFAASPTHVAQIVRKLKLAYRFGWTGLHNVNRVTLKMASTAAVDSWVMWLASSNV